MQETHSSNPAVVTGILHPNKFRVRYHCSLKLGSKLKYLNKKISQFNPRFMKSELFSGIFFSSISAALPKWECFGIIAFSSSRTYKLFDFGICHDKCDAMTYSCICDIFPLSYCAISIHLFVIAKTLGVFLFYLFIILFLPSIIQE